MPMSDHKLKTGYTTGTCAAAAAKAAAVFLLTGQQLDFSEILLPGGQLCRLKTEMKRGLWESEEDDKIWFRVQKDAGDDPDVTHGTYIYGSAEFLKEPDEKRIPAICCGYSIEEFPGLFLTGGPGVGMVTKQGLSCPPGHYAINPGPRRMILSAVWEICEQTGFSGRLLVRISIPEGIKLAEKTFNPRLGIEGGISVLGTTGIVKPMSEDAMIETIRLDIHMQAAAGQKVILMAPGNYGERFLADKMGVPMGKAVLCSNYVKIAAEMMEKEGISKVLFAGHVGKLVKVSAGVENTHSRLGDGRMEQMAFLTREVLREKRKEGEICSEDEEELCLQIRRCNTTDEALELLKKEQLAGQVLLKMAEKIRVIMENWSGGHVEFAVIVFSSACEVLEKTENTAAVFEQWGKQKGCL